MRHIHLALPIFVLLTLTPALCGSEPFRPSDDTHVLLRLPAHTVQGSITHPLAELRRRRAQLAERPNDALAALDFAHFALEAGRKEGDPRFYGYVEGAMAPWWQRPIPSPEALLVRATLAQHRHQFESALADLEQVLRRHPRWSQAWLSRAIILAVQGRLQEAEQSCLPLGRLSSRLLAVACRSHVGGLGPEPGTAYNSLVQTLAASPRAAENERLWAQTTLAEIAARRGHLEVAEGHFRDALAIDARDLYTSLAFADLLLHQERATEVVELLRHETRRTSLLLRLALAEDLLQAPEKPRHVASLGQRYAAGQRREERLHLGEEARFQLDLLHRPAIALELAEANWQLQREPIDARILVRSALAAEAPLRAQPVVEHVRRSGLRDVVLDDLLRRLPSDEKPSDEKETMP